MCTLKRKYLLAKWHTSIASSFREFINKSVSKRCSILGIKPYRIDYVCCMMKKHGSPQEDMMEKHSNRLNRCCILLSSCSRIIDVAGRDRKHELGEED
jgi:hypothetical protein